MPNPDRSPEIPQDSPVRVVKVIFLLPLEELERVKLLAAIRNTAVTTVFRQAIGTEFFLAQLEEQGFNNFEAIGPEGERMALERPQTPAATQIERTDEALQPFPNGEQLRFF